MRYERDCGGGTKGGWDGIERYRTDAEIPYYGRRVLDDSRHYFPEYEAVYLYRSDLARRAPRWLAALQGLSGRIDAQTMQRLNARVKLDRETGAQEIGRAHV